MTELSKNALKTNKLLDKAEINYTRIGGVLVIFDGMPMRLLGQVLSLAEKGWVMGVKSKDNTLALITTGSQADLDNLETNSEFHQLCYKRWKELVDKDAGKDGYYDTLPHNVRHWLERGDHGHSSAWTMFNRTIGQKIDGFFDAEECEMDKHPANIRGFIQSKQLVEVFPEIRETFDEIATISPAWEFIISHWDEYVTKVNAVSTKEEAEALDAEFTSALAGLDQQKKSQNRL